MLYMLYNSHHHEENPDIYQHLPEKNPTNSLISNQELGQRTRQQPTEEEILRRRWRWIGYTLRKPASSRLRNTWHRDLEAYMKRTDHTWGQLEKLAQDRDAWRAMAAFGQSGVTGFIYVDHLHLQTKCTLIPARLGGYKTYDSI